MRESETCTQCSESHAIAFGRESLEDSAQGQDYCCGICQEVIRDARSACEQGHMVRFVAFCACASLRTRFASTVLLKLTTDLAVDSTAASASASGPSGAGGRAPARSAAGIYSSRGTASSTDSSRDSTSVAGTRSKRIRPPAAHMDWLAAGTLAAGRWPHALGPGSCATWVPTRPTAASADRRRAATQAVSGTGRTVGAPFTRRSAPSAQHKPPGGQPRAQRRAHPRPDPAGTGARRRRPAVRRWEADASAGGSISEHGEWSSVLHPPSFGPPFGAVVFLPACAAGCFRAWTTAAISIEAASMSIETGLRCRQSLRRSCVTGLSLASSRATGCCYSTAFRSSMRPCRQPAAHPHPCEADRVHTACPLPAFRSLSRIRCCCGGGSRHLGSVFLG